MNILLLFTFTRTNPIVIAVLKYGYNFNTALIKQLEYSKTLEYSFNTWVHGKIVFCIYIKNISSTDCFVELSYNDDKMFITSMQTYTFLAVLTNQLPNVTVMTFCSLRTRSLCRITNYGLLYVFTIIVDIELISFFLISIISFTIFFTVNPIILYYFLIGIHCNLFVKLIFNRYLWHNYIIRP